MFDGGKPDSSGEQQKWAKIWFLSLARFHRVPEPNTWEFTNEDVIAFLRAKLKTGMPAWKRVKIVEGLIQYRDSVRQSSKPDLEPIRTKLREIASAEKLAEEEIPIEDVIGKINPREPDVIQAYRRKLRLLGKQLTTEKAYVGKLRAFMEARGLKKLTDFDDVTSTDVEGHLTDLAVDGNVAASTQNQAFYALLFLFEHVLQREIGKINAIRSTKAPRVPTVMSEEEVFRVLSHLKGPYLLIGQLLYGSGMRISECLRLRVKDIDFDQMLIELHHSKGNKSRRVPLPEELVQPLRKLLKDREAVHEQDLITGEASVWLPTALDRKYPSAHREFKWQFLFASAKFSRDPRTGKRHRHHLHSGTFPTHLRRAVQEAGIHKHITSHTFRHSFATHLLKGNTDIRSIQELLGHNDLNTTAIYTHVLNRPDIKIVSPLDQLMKTIPPEASNLSDREPPEGRVLPIKRMSKITKERAEDNRRLSHCERSEKRGIRRAKIDTIRPPVLNQPVGQIQELRRVRMKRVSPEQGIEKSLRPPVSLDEGMGTLIEHF